MEIVKMNYGLVIKDNDEWRSGDNEIYILGSPGQNGKCSLVIINMSVDGGIHGLPEVVVNIPYGEKCVSEIPKEIYKGLCLIRFHYTKDCPFLNLEDVNQILEAWQSLMEV